MPEESQENAGERTAYSPEFIPDNGEIAYNTDRDKTPGGLKARWIIKIATGKEAERVAARQAEAIRELVTWARHYHQHQRPATRERGADMERASAAPGQDTSTGSPAIPVAFTGRTSTLMLQDPVASLRRQVRECQDKLPPGMFLAAYYWDIESGGLDISERGHGTAHESVLDQVGIPRDGGLADLLTEAASPTPRFAAVICEDIERSGRDTFYALKLEKELTQAGIPLFATDEPIDIAGANATTVLVRRVKQGVAEWFRLQIKEKSWRGLREHSLAGWNIGPVPYGYTADRVPHPVPVKAAQGRFKTRLTLDPQRAPAVQAIFTWRTVDKIGSRAIRDRLDADHGQYPPLDPDGWSEQTVYGILRNPKYTGHMVYGRRRKINGKVRQAPPSEWIWSPEPTHPAIISRATWDAAQAAGAEHGTSRDDTEPNTHPQTRRSYVFRSRLRCHDCQRRMSGHNPSGHASYYVCPHTPKIHYSVRTYPSHPARVSVREDRLIAVLGEFCDTHLFGPGRAGHLARMLPGTAASEAQQREKKTAGLRKRLQQIDTAEDGYTREIEALAHQGGHAAAVTALRSRILARFTDLEEERTQITKQLATLTRQDQAPRQDASLLDDLPLLDPGTFTHAPARTLALLIQALDIQAIYDKTHDQATIRATLTGTTPDDIAALLTTHQPAPGNSEPAQPDAECEHLVGRPIAPKNVRADQVAPAARPAQNVPGWWMCQLGSRPR